MKRQMLRLVAIAAFATVAAGALLAFYSRSAQDTSRPVKQFTVTVRTFETGSFDPSTITVSRGDRVIIVFRSVDTTHGVAIDEYGVNTGPIGAGQEKRVEFVADRVGTFGFYCNIVCSGLHLRQIGQLIVQ